MPSYGGATTDTLPDRSKKTKSLEVSSRFLSSSPIAGNGNKSPNTSQALTRSKSSSESRKQHKTFEKSGFFQGLWPSSSSPSVKPDDNTLADCIGSDRAREKFEERKNRSKRGDYPVFLNRQRSCTELNRFDETGKKLNSKENQKPVFGGSTRYTGNLNFAAGKPSDLSEDIVPGRFSVDEISLRKKPSGLWDSESESEYSDASGGRNQIASYMASTVSSRKHGIEVPSRFLRDRRGSSTTGLDPKADSETNSSINDSPKVFSLKKGKSNGNWGSSSPNPNPKPPTSPSRGKIVGNILSIGIELLKGKKPSSSASPSPLGPGAAESAHQLRVLQSTLMQWRYGNARAETVNRKVINQAQKQMLEAWNGIRRLHYSVVQKKVEVERQKLEWKLNCILHSQMKMLEMWEKMEEDHSWAVSKTKDCVHSVVCRVPLVHGAKAEEETTGIAIGDASQVAASINFLLTTSSPQIEETMGMMCELAMVVRQEKLLLEECVNLYTSISALQIQERSLKTTLIQFKV